MQFQEVCSPGSGTMWPTVGSSSLLQRRVYWRFTFIGATWGGDAQNQADAEDNAALQAIRFMESDLNQQLHDFNYFREELLIDNHRSMLMITKKQSALLSRKRNSNPNNVTFAIEELTVRIFCEEFCNSDTTSKPEAMYILSSIEQVTAQLQQTVDESTTIFYN
ncbi:hypothetical protein ACP70R_032778 [Stipagrostis hirtigluma subsp. patula]